MKLDNINNLENRNFIARKIKKQVKLRTNEKRRKD